MLSRWNPEDVAIESRKGSIPTSDSEWRRESRFGVGRIAHCFPLKLKDQAQGWLVGATPPRMTAMQVSPDKNVIFRCTSSPDHCCASVPA